VRKLLFVLILGLAPAVASTAFGDVSPNSGKKVHLERVVAIVNDSIILQSELDARLQPVLQEAQQIPDENERKRRIAKLTGQRVQWIVPRGSVS